MFIFLNLEKVSGEMNGNEGRLTEKKWMNMLENERKWKDMSINKS